MILRKPYELGSFLHDPAKNTEMVREVTVLGGHRASAF